jgi:predicted MPP superfamily phosphohydrolase
MRRLFGTIAGLGVFAGLLVALYARYIEPQRPRLSHVNVRLPRRHAHLDGLTIAFVSDTHVCPHFAASSLEPVVAMLERLQPDLVLFGGDYVSESPRYVADAVPPLTRMAATGRLGAFGVLGNHDIANIRSRVEKPLAAAGIRFLTNESTCIEYGGGDLWLVGIDEVILGKPDPVRAFSAVPADAATIVLWHEPDLAEQIAPFGPIVQLSGHTHGGQVRLPVVGPLALPKMGHKFPVGRYEILDMTLLVSRGIGIYRPPVRLNCPPETMVIHFVA